MKSKLRQILTAALAAALLLTLLPAAATALDTSRAYTLKLTPSQTTAKYGDEITFTLTLTGSEGAIYAFQDELEWDTSQFELVGEPSPASGFSVTKKPTSGTPKRAAFSFVSVGGGTNFVLPLTVGTFKLRVKASADETLVVGHKDYKLSNKSGTDLYQVSAADARINDYGNSNAQEIVKAAETTVKANVTVSGGEASVLIRSADIQAAVEEAKGKAALESAKPENAGKRVIAELVIDLRTPDGGTHAAKARLIVADVNLIANEPQLALVIRTDAFTAVEFSDGSLRAITAGKADSEPVTITAGKLNNTANLTDAQTAAIGGELALELRVEVSGSAVNSFRGGEVKVTVKYTPPGGMPADDYELLTAYHIAADAATEAMKGSVYSDGQMNFTTTHFSTFYITEWLNPFTDIKKSNWYYKAARYTNINGLISGNGNSWTFAPNVSVSRAMMVTILWRQAGSPKSGGSDFTDVPKNKYYTDAVDWASANGIVSGNGDGTFAPNRDITRQEMAKMMHNYAVYLGYAGAANTELSFGDSANIANWALDAVKWCAANGVINGDTKHNFNPTASAKRSELAQIFKNYGSIND
jgi:hypothetical protein